MDNFEETDIIERYVDHFCEDPVHPMLLTPGLFPHITDYTDDLYGIYAISDVRE